MAVNLSIKNVPEAMAAKLRERAERHHRSLQGELMAIIDQATREVDSGVSGKTLQGDKILERPATAPRRLSIEEVAAAAHRLFPRGTPSSAGFIRDMRDGRYGEAWAKTGRHAEPG